MTKNRKDKIKEHSINSCLAYVNKKQELDKFLEKLIAPFIRNKKLNILDACCGIGHNSYWLNLISPKSSFFGVDTTDYLIEEGKKLFVEDKNISLEVGDVNDLPQKYSKYFDISLTCKALSFITYYENMLRALLEVTKKHIFLSSLFYEGDIDFFTEVKEYKKGVTTFYNVYSLPKFKDFIYSLGAKNIEVYDFEMGIDLPKGTNRDFMGTYTEKLENGKRLQISGAVVMSWKIVRIDL